MAEDRRGLKPSQAVYPNTVALTHQRGCVADKLRAAAAAARADVNSPKQVAPEPDMRASSQPGSLRSAASTRAITGWSLIAAGSRSLRSPARNSTRPSRSRGKRPRSCGARPPAPGLEAEHREHVPGRDRDARIDQHRRELRHRQRRGQHFADAAHPPRARLDADRHVGAEPARHLLQPPVIELEPIGAGQQAERGAGIGRPAAQSRRHRQALVQREAPKLQIGDFGRKRIAPP